MSASRAVFRAVVLILWLLLLLLPAVVARYVYFQRANAWLVRRFFGGALRILGIELVVHDAPRKPRSVLFISNHCSYLDVVAMGAAIPVRFTPKLDIKHWPVIGFLTTLTGAIYIHRSAPLKSMQQQQSLQDHLFLGENVSLFAEGTTNDGSGILPFKTALFRAAKRIDAEDPVIQVVPVTIVYTRVNGEKVTTQAQRDVFAWYGEMEFLPHLWRMMGQESLRVELYFDAPVTYERFESRKELAAYCREKIEGRFREVACIGVGDGLPN